MKLTPRISTTLVHQSARFQAVKATWQPEEGRWAWRSQVNSTCRRSRPKSVRDVTGDLWIMVLSVFFSGVWYQIIQNIPMSKHQMVQCACTGKDKKPLKTHTKLKAWPDLTALAQTAESEVYWKSRRLKKGLVISIWAAKSRLLGVNFKLALGCFLE